MGGMLVSRLSAGMMASIFLVSIPAIAADDDEALPVPHTLSCETACAKFIPAEHISRPIPSYPPYETGFYGPYVEGFVSLQYKVSAEGKVDDVVVMHLLGPQEFADRSVRAVRSWTFKPATRDGKPVAQCRHMKFVFRVPDAPAGARDEITRAYRLAHGLIKDGKFDDARGVLAEAQARPRLNFYERGMLAYLTAQVALKKNDLLAMRTAVELPTEFNMVSLPPAVVRDLWRLRTLSSLYLGDYVDAAASLEELKKVKDFDAVDPILKLVEERRAAADAMPQYALRAQIPEAGLADGFNFGLHRRTFAFQNISGALDKFTLRCKQSVVESSISTAAQWTVPKSWSECFVFVRGKPGTTFNIVQATG